jgi:L-lysine 6-transaminase
MPPVLTESARTSARSRTASSKPHKQISQPNPADVLKTLEEHILMDGFRIVIDLEKSRGSYLYDAASGHRLIDLYGFFGSVPVGFNHPHFDKPKCGRNCCGRPR